MSHNDKVKKLLVGALLCGGLAVGGSWLAAGTAQADNFTVPHDWCPGQPLPMPDVRWDMNVCHHWYWVPVGGMGNVGQFVWEGNAPRQPLGPPPCYGAPICLPGL
ncbi:hypothetical protein OQ968_17735 [Mycobacterium sp. 663a-19]|uniref:hypothetical protein n=1 Tax=Mycobacterium sp. 663a-19 TaxID=2986148 RepID=UPI002D1EAA3A|nr:hypothetical protein [Mycobacterium sp. 663a-19]MEB3983104.1 hypothetical protein [Mycobacterium sp. 663a-19]